MDRAARRKLYNSSAWQHVRRMKLRATPLCEDCKLLGIIKAAHELNVTTGQNNPSAVMSGVFEALVATAVGLFVAIPAVVAYNQITVSLGRSAERAGTSIALLAKAIARGQSEGSVRLEGVG